VELREPEHRSERSGRVGGVDIERRSGDMAAGRVPGSAMRRAAGRPVTSTFDVTAAPRAVLRESVRLLHRVLGDERMGDAAANARAAVRADEERARARAEVNRLLEAARRTG
jgi:hypothetical protein